MGSVPSRAPWYAVVVGVLLIALDGQQCEWANVCPDVAQRIEARMTVIEVEVDIFSGMPNPHWTLSDADAATFLSKLSELQKGEARSRLDRLGYCGLELVVRAAQGADRKVFVHNGVVETSDGTTTSSLLDSQRSLERWLIGTGKEFLSHKVMEAINSDLQ